MYKSLCTFLALYWLCIDSIHSDNKVPIYVLSLLPYEDSNGLHGWDRGLDLLPAGRLAVKHVNNQSDVLPGYTIYLKERASDACGRSVVTKGLYNFVGNAVWFEDATNSVAVIGLACSLVTSTVSPIAGRADLLQLSMANSQVLRNKEAFPHLWRFLSTSDVYVDVMVMLMENFGWNKVGLIFEGNGVFFLTIAESFKKATESKNITTVVDEINSNSEIINKAINRIRSKGVRIIFAPTSIPESIQIMCEAAKQNLVWPGYVWIFPSRKYNEFFHSSTKCEDESQMIKALENVIFIDTDLSERDGNTVLVSGVTFDQYMHEYQREYENIQMEFPTSSGYHYSSQYNVYASAMYDEVWALALALNSSLEELAKKNLTLEGYQYNMPKITSIIENNLRKVEFSGALSNARFNEHLEVPTGVNIFQVRNGMSVQIGIFKNESLKIFNISEENVPSDDFIRIHPEISDTVIGLICEIIIIAIVLFLVTVLLFVSTIFLKKEPEILASSPLLSVFIFVGCFLLILASVLTVFQLLKNSTILVSMCYIGNWSAQSGNNLIATAILVRLVRVYRIFTHFGKTGKIWQDKFLFCIVLLISFVSSILIVIGVIADPLLVVEVEEYRPSMNPPIVEIIPQCKSKHGLSTIFDIIGQIYTGFLIVLLLAFAVLTRKVNKKNFKDTKKITIFIFLFTIITSVSVVLSHIFDQEVISLAILSHSYLVSVVVCLSLLILPKVVPAFYYRVYKKQKRSYYSTTEKNSTISKLVATSIYTVVTKEENIVLPTKRTSRFGSYISNLSK